MKEDSRLPTNPEQSLRFIPSSVEGLPSVTETCIFPDRVELLSEGKWVVFRFLDIARWDRLGWYYRMLVRFGRRVRGRPTVADRDWFHPPSGRFFEFYSKPRVKFFLPDESRELKYEETLFRKIQNIIEQGGFGTEDLG